MDPKSQQSSQPGLQSPMGNSVPVSTQTQQPSMPSSPQPTQPATGPVVPPPPQVKKRSNIWMIIVVIVIVLGLAGLLIYQYYINKPTGSMYKNTTSTITPTAAPSPTIGAVKSGDQQLDQQSDAIDQNMEKLNNDVRGVDSGLNDKAIDLNQ